MNEAESKFEIKGYSNEKPLGGCFKDWEICLFMVWKY